VSGRFDIAGRVALVTGASSGIGAHFARRLAAEGAVVVAAARRVDRLATLVQQISAAGGRAHALALDVTDAANVNDGVARCVADHGGIDMLINNAGVTATKPFLEQDETTWRSVLGTDLDGVWRVGRCVAETMATRGRGGAIVNIASILSFRVAGHLSAYAAAKAGVMSLTQSMALELARHRIRVNALAPGYIETDLNRDFLGGSAGEEIRKRVPMRRFGRPDDLDGALLLLVSDAGAFITGTTLPVDGGHLLRFI
jgi:NAD(P)-dependent dehydrogenase (short-subunit alcohol dehydrogenase family)